MIGIKLVKQYDAIESGVIDLVFAGERIKELKDRREQIKESLDEIVRPHIISIVIYTDQSIESFQKTIKEMFFCGDRIMTKRYLKLFIEKILIKLPTGEMIYKTDRILGVLENKNAVKTDGVLTAIDFWLPGTDHCKNFRFPFHLSIAPHPTALLLTTSNSIF